MKISINGKEREIPTSWKEVTFETFCKIAEREYDALWLLSVFLDVPHEEMKVARVKNFPQVLAALNFAKYPLSNAVPKTILGFPVPPDLISEEVGRYEDSKIVSKDFGKDAKADMGRYPELCAIWAMPNYTDATRSEQESFVKQFLQGSCEEVMALGNFIVAKLVEWSLSSGQASPKGLTTISRLRLAIKVWRMRMAFSVRLNLWRLRHRIGGMSF